MRNLFLVLVLANLAFAAWAAWFAPAGSVGRRADEGLPALTLVSEVPVDLRSSGVVVEQEDAPGAAEQPLAVAPQPVPTSDPAAAQLDDSAAAPLDESALAAAPSAAEPTARCTSVGPFRELSQAATAAATLRNAGYQPVQRVGEGDVWIGYWVYIPGISTEQEANEILAKVRAEGIADSYVIPNSDSGNLVSLGVFSEISGVGRRRDQVRALGFEPQVVDRTRRATVYWIDVTLAEGQVLDFDALQPPGRIIRLEQRACEAPV
jgi:cell division septation protein DedD